MEIIHDKLVLLLLLILCTKTITNPLVQAEGQSKSGQIQQKLSPTKQLFYKALLCFHLVGTLLLLAIYAACHQLFLWQTSLLNQTSLLPPWT